MVEIVASLLN